MGRQGLRRPRADLVLLLGALSALVAAMWLPRAGRVVSVVTCVDAPGPLRWAGLHLSVLTESAQCPTGELALQPAASHPALITVMVTVPLLLGYVLSCAGLVGCWAVLRGAVRVVARLVARLWTPIDGVAHVVVTPLTRREAPAAALPPGRVEGLPFVRRGPPSALAH